MGVASGMKDERKKEMINYNFNYFKQMEPMKYYDKRREDLSDNLKKKYDSMVSNEDNGYIASCKNDGEWSLCMKWDGKYLIRSRSISKLTGEYGDKTAHLPHLVEEMKSWPDRSVVLAEICWGKLGTVSTDVGTILRCLPERAIERQKEKKLVAKVFDALAWNGEVWMQNSYDMRIHKVINLFPDNDSCYFTSTDICPSHLTPAEFADDIISKGGEGVVIQRKDYAYEPGKRAAWKTLKLKQRLPEMEFKVTAVIPANKEYNGKYPETWPYWSVKKSVNQHIEYDEQGNKKVVPIEIEELIENPTEEQKMSGYPVSKPYFLDWCMGVRFEYEGVTCDASSGLTDVDREWLGTQEATTAIKNGELYVVVRGMQIATNGAIRHPVIVRLRTDM